MIDEGIVQPWPDEVVAAVARFRQGDLVERPPFFYLGVARHGIWKLTRDLGDPELEDEIFELDPEDSPPYGIITQQTCDLIQEERTPRQPWFGVSPVYDMSDRLDKNQLQRLSLNRYRHQALLASKALPPGLWVADLRIEFPVEKSWLVGREPIASFREDAQYEAFAEILGTLKNRPDIDDRLSQQLVKPLRRWIERMKPPKYSRLMEPVAEVRLAIAGHRLSPDGAQLIVVSEQQLPQEVRDEWDQKWQAWKETLDSTGISLLATRYTTMDELTAREYVNSVAIDLTF